MGIQLQDITVAGAFDVNAVHTCLRKYGVAVLPSWCSDADAANLRKEFLEILEDKDERYMYPINYAPGKAASIMRAGLPSGHYPLIQRVFSD